MALCAVCALPKNYIKKYGEKVFKAVVFPLFTLYVGSCHIRLLIVFNFFYLFLSFLSLYTLHSVVAKVCLTGLKKLSAYYSNDHKLLWSQANKWTLMSIMTVTM